MEQKPEIVQRYENDPKGYYDPVELEDIFHYYAENGMVEQLKPVMDLSIALHPDDHSTRIMQAEYQLNLGSPEESLRLMEPIFQEENPYLCILRSGALAKLSKIEEAIEWAETACSLHDDPFICYDLGIGFLNAQQYEVSLRYFLRCHEQTPDDLRCILGILYGLGKVGTAEETLSFAEKAIQIDSLSWEGWLNKASALSELERYEEALDSYDYAIAIRPEVAEPYVMKANLLCELDKPDEALSASEEAIPYADGEEMGNLMLLRAHLYLLKDMRAEALEATWRAIESAPLSDDVCNRAVQSFVALDATNEALLFLRAAYNRGARDVLLLITLGDLLSKNEEYEDALAVYQDLYEVTQSGGAANLIASVYMSMSKYRKAYYALRDANKVDPLWQSAILMTVCAHELEWYTAMERHFITACMVNHEGAHEMLKSISEKLYKTFEERGILERAEQARQELLRDETINMLLAAAKNN